MTRRARVFQAYYWVVSIVFALSAAIALIVPGRRLVGMMIKAYSKAMVWGLHVIADVKLQVIGRERVPEGAIIASKHHSWNDGFALFSQFDDLAFVCGDHLLSYPLLGKILDRLGAVVISSKGGPAAVQTLQERGAAAAKAGRSVLIFPEGHLSPVGTHHRYRAGVWLLQQAFDKPVVPVATNLGLFSPLALADKHPGTATIEFLDPIAPGLPKAEFLHQLQAVIEANTNRLIGQVRGAIQPSIEIESAEAYFAALAEAASA